MDMCRGFILIELLIAIALGSMIIGILTNSMYHTQQFEQHIDEYVSVYNRAVLIMHQLERDLTGAYIPVQPHVPSKDIKTEEEQPKPIDKLFYGTVQSENNFAELTCITSSPMLSYWSEKTGQARPYKARVMYRLKPHKKEKNVFTLTRQENAELMYGAYKEDGKDKKSIRAYDIAHSVRACTLTYMYTEMDAKDNGKKNLVKLTEWVEETSKTASAEEKKQKRPPLPEAIEVHLTLWDDEYKHEHSFIWTISLLVRTEQKRIPELPKMQHTKKVTDSRQVKRNAAQSKNTEHNAAHMQALRITL